MSSVLVSKLKRKKKSKYIDKEQLLCSSCHFKLNLTGSFFSKLDLMQRLIFFSILSYNVKLSLFLQKSNQLLCSKFQLIDILVKKKSYAFPKTNMILDSTRSHRIIINITNNHPQFEGCTRGKNRKALALFEQQVPEW